MQKKILFYYPLNNKNNSTASSSAAASSALGRMFTDASVPAMVSSSHVRGLSASVSIQEGGITIADPWESSGPMYSARCDKSLSQIRICFTLDVLSIAFLAWCSNGPALCR